MALAKAFERHLDLSRYDEPDDTGSWNLVYSLVSIEDSCRALTEELLPRLAAMEDADSLRNTLTDVGEELRHLVHHIGDARYFAYLGVGADDKQTEDC
jgi:hypothetical protein